MFFNKKENEKDNFFEKPDVINEKTRALYLESVRLDSTNFEGFPDVYKNNKEFVMDVLDISPYSYLKLNDDLKRDTDICLKFYNGDRKNIQYIPSDVFENADVYKAFLANSTGFYSELKEHFPDSLKSDRDFFLGYSDNIKFGGTIAFADESIKGDREIALLFMHTNPMFIDYISKDLKNDRDFVLGYFKENPEYIYAVSGHLEDLTKDKHFIVDGIKLTRDVNYIVFADETIKNDKKLVGQLIHLDSFDVRNLGSELRKDSEILNDVIIADFRKILNSDSVGLKRDGLRNLVDNLEFMYKSDSFDLTLLNEDSVDLIRNYDFTEACSKYITNDEMTFNKFENIKESFLRKYDFAVAAKAVVAERDEKFKNFDFDSLVAD